MLAYEGLCSSASVGLGRPSGACPKSLSLPMITYGASSPTASAAALGTLMRMSAERHLAATREAVWAALNDLHALRDCIPGCEKLERLNENLIAAQVMAKVGPVAARFTGTLAISDVSPPNGYALTGKGQGGAAGFAHGRAQVRLLAGNGGTKVKYDIDATVGGKLAQLGSRLIDAAARKIADDFFDRLATRLAGTEPVASRKEPTRDGLRPWIWVPLLIALVMSILYVFTKL